MSALLIVLIFSSGVLHSQNLIFEPVHIKEVLKKEKELNSKFVKNDFQVFLSEDLYPSKDHLLHQPKVFVRTKSQFSPVPKVEYFYDSEEKLVRYVNYIWDISNEVDVLNFKEYFDNQKKESIRIEEYYRFYKKILKTLKSRFGEQNITTNGLIENTINENVYKESIDKWISEKFLAELTMKFSLSEDTRFGVYKISLRMYWK